ncbi:hypothetical protein B0H14DRAFT_3489288 [Mycena olivaceomarginata]|nr:hypothetical protein B0H14DRAFT_3489288 [Mycena olivaceomarginata]
MTLHTLHKNIGNRLRAHEEQKPAASEQASANEEAPEEAPKEAEAEEEEPEILRGVAREKVNAGEDFKGEDCVDGMYEFSPCTSPVPSIPALTDTDLAFPSPRTLRIVFSPHDALLRSLRRAQALV